MVPGVTSAALTTQLPLSGDSDIYGLKFESSDPGAAADGAAFRYGVSPGYFDTMGLTLRRGRFIADLDRADTQLAAVINDAFARRRFPHSDPIGERLHIGPTDRPWFTIVGVVSDVKQLSLEEDWPSAVYVAPQQWHFADSAYWFVIKSATNPSALTPLVRDAIWSIDRNQPIVRIATLSAVVAATARERSFALLLFEVFGLSALLLTAIGIYGVVAGGVNDRMREIGVRTALGASRRQILAMILKQGVALSAAGVAIGLAIAAIASRGLTSLLFGVSPLDPLSYAAVVIVLVGVAILASWLPAWRASRIDPSVTLRSE
jgi:putative ABC transport system permease protein